MKKILFYLLLNGSVFICLNAQNVKEIKIGNSIWMSENLNKPVDGSWIYNDEISNGSKYGRLYSWEAAKKACPTGWHLPNDKEWAELIDHAGGSEHAGIALKAGGNSGFNARLGGFSSVGNFLMLNSYGMYWSSNEYDKEHAWYIFFNSKDNMATKTFFTKTYGLSVRCVKGK